ncbi:hypothetical protein GCM10023334_039650 [Nonomuraea thailandensis]
MKTFDVSLANVWPADCTRAAASLSQEVCLLCSRVAVGTPVGVQLDVSVFAFSPAPGADRNMYRPLSESSVHAYALRKPCDTAAGGTLARDPRAQRREEHAIAHTLDLLEQPGRRAGVRRRGQ